MKIVFAGGGTGGHFYPLIAVVEGIEDAVEEKHLVAPEFYLLGPHAFDGQTLIEHGIEYVPSAAGRIRRYASILNVLDIFKTGWGIIQTLFSMFSIYPDVVFSTGGYAAFPTLFAARLLGIPVVIYDADAKPGRVSLWSARFARWIAVAHPRAALEFPEHLREKIANTGHPIRQEIEHPTAEGGYEFLKLDAALPTIFIMGGSQGAKAINDTVLSSLADLAPRYNIIHQTGSEHIEEVEGIARVVLKGTPYENHYRVYGLMNTLALRMAAGIANLVVARAGSGTIFEIASWKKPSILIPIPPDVSHDQTENAFSYARAGAAVVIEQNNLSQHVLTAEIDRILGDEKLTASLAGAAGAFARPDAGRKVANIILETALEHEK